MKRQIICGMSAVIGVLLLTGCANEKKNLSTMLNTNDLVFNGTIESVPSKVGVYTAMSRAAKYHVDVSAQNMLKKVYNGAEDPVKITKKILASGQTTDKLYNAARALDFANAYAISVIVSNPKYVENLLYAKSAQNLSVGAIKLHREAIFADKHIAKIDRMIKQQQKILDDLTKKMERNGTLNDPEMYYHKGLSVGINKLAEMRNQLDYVRTEYMELISSDNRKVKLEGKPFYELDDFDKRYKPEVFQDSAMTNRNEFALAKEELGTYNSAIARRQAFADYPPVARLDINGLEVEDFRYEEELFNKSERISLNLIEAIQNFERFPVKMSSKQNIFDKLSALVMAQVELGHRLVEKSIFDYDANRYKIEDTKKIIKEMEKNPKLSGYEKVDLLNKRIELIAYEQNEAQYLSERAAAIRNLYFLAGLSPFDKTMLKGRIKDIETTLKQAFNKDVVTMLSSVNDSPNWSDGGNTWARDENWLEDLVKKENKPVKKATKTNVKTKLPSETVVKKGHTMLQLGAYTDMSNATADIEKIKNAVEELKKQDVFIEKASVDGVLYHRVLVKPEQSDMISICNKVIDAGFDCIAK